MIAGLMNQENYKTLEQRFLALAAAALGRGDATGLRVTDPPSTEAGDLAIGCHGIAKELKSDPQSLAQKIAAAVEIDPLFAGAKAENGYVNVRFAPARLFAAVANEVAAGESDPARAFGRDADARIERWLIEYSGPNTNKPLHIGHLRNTIRGFAMANLVKLHGHDVVRYNIVNDRGIHICKSMVAYERFGTGATPQSTGEKGDHFVGRMYSLFASKAAEEFEAWARGAGAAEIEAYLTANAA